MKYQYFLLIWIAICVLLTELAARKIFQVSVFSVVWWWLKYGDNRVLGAFLVVLFGLLFTVFMAARTTDTYTALTGKSETYIFTGDKLQQGFYGYRAGDATQQEVFIPSFLDATVYPATSFQSLYYPKTIWRDAQGNTVKADMLGLGSQIIWALFTCLAGAVFVAGVLLVFKSYGIGHSLLTATNGLADVWQLSQVKTGGKFLWTMLAVVGMLMLFIGLLKTRNTTPVPDDAPVAALPQQVQAGNVLLGKILASEVYAAELGADRSFTDKRTNKRYTVQFDSRSGFEVPVYIQWDARLIREGNLQNKANALKQELEVKKEYYDLAFARCDAAQGTQADVAFLVTEDLQILPYLEEKKALIAPILQSAW